MHRQLLRVWTISSTDVVIFGADTRRTGRWLRLWAGGLWYSQQDQRSDRRWPAYCWTERSGELILACWLGLLQQWPMSHVKWNVTVNKTANIFFPTWLVWIDSLTSSTHTAWKTKWRHFKYTFIFRSEMSGVELVSQRSNSRSQTSDAPQKKKRSCVILAQWWGSDSELFSPGPSLWKSHRGSVDPSRTPLVHRSTNACGVILSIASPCSTHLTHIASA